MARFTGEAGAALVFLIGYLLVFVWMLYLYLTHCIKLRSWFSLLFLHVTVRVATQVCGVAFGILGFSSKAVFLVYLILGAEGYLTIVICAFRFLVTWHQHNLPSHESWLDPKKVKHTRSDIMRKLLEFVVLGPFTIVLYWRRPLLIMDLVLTIANVAIIIGGTYLSHLDFQHIDDPVSQNKLFIAKILRTSGQSIFLACTVFLLIAILATIAGDRKRGTRVHPTLLLILASWFPLIIRGFWGVLQSAVWSLSYYNVQNYNSEGFTPHFTALEYILGVLTEWTACMLLLVTYYTSKDDPPIPQSSRLPQVEDQLMEMDSQ